MTDRSAPKPRSLSQTPSTSRVVPVGSWQKARSSGKSAKIVSRKSSQSAKFSLPKWPRLSAGFSHTPHIQWGALPLLILLFSSLWVFWPVGTQCITDQFTKCSEEESAFLAQTFSRRSQVLLSNPLEVEREMQYSFIEIESVSSKIHPLGSTQVVIKRSQPVAVVKIGDEWYQVLSAGQRRKVDTDSYPAIQFQDESMWQAWLGEYPQAPDAAVALGALSRQTKSLHPRATTIQILSSSEVVMRLENTSRVLLSLPDETEINRQLRTLQAVFNASTIEELPNEVDVRFKNVIIRN